MSRLHAEAVKKELLVALGCHRNFLYILEFLFFMFKMASRNE